MKFAEWLLTESDLEIGQVFEIPAQGNRSSFRAQIVKIQRDTVWVRQLSPNDQGDISQDPDRLLGAVKMTRAAVRHFVNDLSGKVDVKGKSNDPWINKVLNGQASYLGKGDDGAVFDAGDMIVKVSTTVPFQPFNNYHRSPSEAARMMFNNAKMTEAARSKGVPGILPTYVKIVGDKAFMVRPKVNILKKLSREQLREVKQSIEAMHKVGYTINDEIQVGEWKGRMYHFDLGKMTANNDPHYQKSDMDYFDLLASKSGIDFPEKQWQYLISMLMFFSKDSVKGKVDEDKRRKLLQKLVRQKVLMDREYPERKEQTEKEFHQAVEGV
jgi:hypothetical protein